MDFEKILGVLNIRETDEKRVHRFLEKTTGITFAPLPHLEIDAAPVDVDNALLSLDGQSLENIKKLVGSNAEVAVALGDKLLSNVYRMKHVRTHATFKELMNLPETLEEVPEWQKKVIQDFKDKYTGHTYERKWSSGAHTVVAIRLLELAKTTESKGLSKSSNEDIPRLRSNN